MFTGVALFEFGSAPYLSGSMENFLYHTNTQSGEVQGCLLPSGATGTIFHAKPVIIQGAWLAAQEVDRQNNNRQKVLYFKRYAKQMAALLRYWTSTTRSDEKTQLPKWYNQRISRIICLYQHVHRHDPLLNPVFHELDWSADLATFCVVNLWHMGCSTNVGRKRRKKIAASTRKSMCKTNGRKNKSCSKSVAF